LAVPRKRIRGKRARAHWQRRGRDLREHYRAGDSAGPDLAVVEFDDAFGSLEPEAQLRQVVHPDGGVGVGAPEWRVPSKPKIRAVARLKQDPLRRMFHRQQLEQAQFAAGREYQALHIMTRVGSVQTVDWAKTRVQGGRVDPLPDRRHRASRKLHFADSALMHRHGAEGLTLIKDVLCECRSIDQAGRLRGAKSALEKRWFGTLFRKCLSVLAVQFGFASSTRRLPEVRHLNGDGGIPDTADSSLHADAGDLADAQLRSGRSNGRG
jgi:hypothetical protein